MQKNRYIVLIIMIILTSLLVIEPVYADSCNGILTPGAYQILQDALSIIRIAVPILLIVLGSVDLGTAVVSEDKDSLKKATSRLIKRCLAAIVIFFIPLIVNVLINLVESSGGINIVDDPMCGIK